MERKVVSSADGMSIYSPPYKGGAGGGSTGAVFLLSLALCLVAVLAQAQTFDDDFDGRTLRLDYVFAGTATEQHVFFEHAYATPQWAGRRAHLTDVPLRGNGQIALYDHQTGRQLFVHTFSTLFQEWLATEEATRVAKSFQASYNVPMPRRTVDVSVTLTDFHDSIVARLQHTIDPADALIRQLGPNGIPHYYIYKGGEQADAFADADLAGCIDVAIVAEGYTKADMPKFRGDCQRTVDALFAHEPFASLKHRFNVVCVAAPSLASGPSVPQQRRWNLTPAATHYDTFYSDRYLMTQDMHRLYDLLCDVPFEQVIVLVNSGIYGGGGIYNQLNVFPADHPTFPQVLVHEFGHGYAGLGDEYFYDDQYATMYPADTEPWEPNLTTLVDFASKWADMLPTGTAVPTPPSADVPNYRHIRTDQERQRLNEATQRVGVFEGGGYQSHGVYRPAQECRMKINEVEHFCPVCTRAIQRITEFYTSDF